MRACVVTKPGVMECVDIRPPHPGPYEALVRIDLCVICNTTDHMVINGTFPYPVRYPRVLGHETISTVIEVGQNVTSFRIGDHVTRAGFRADAPDGGLHSTWGGFADFGIAPDVAAARKAGLLSGNSQQAPQVIPPDLALRDAALLISLGETSSFLAQVGDIRDKDVVIVGTGIVGLSMTFFAKRWGARRVTVLGRRRERLAMAAQLGADHIINTCESPKPDTDRLRTADTHRALG